METKDIVAAIVGIIGAIPSYIIALDRWRKRGSGLSMGKWLREIKQSYPFLLGILFTIVMVVLILVGPCTSSLPEVRITSPMDNTSVPMEVTVRGYTTNDLGIDQHLYIVVEYGGCWWPQSSEVTVGMSQVTGKYEFIVPVRIGDDEDAGKTFSIRAILADSAVQQRFQSWFQQHMSTEEWLGIPIVEVNQWGEVTTRDSVSVTRK